ncbi:unnamed protein product [Pleuronectes platessa]|uniref:2-aminoethanethiol dioxygenase n=1 Tax=Pleuronectes platessa TaxID=8262 RepID=A0A9N7UMP1_PLEPL|nr:unnamed protein product [Pleuronectes platessa]
MSPSAQAFGFQRPRPKRLPNAGIPGVLRHTERAHLAGDGKIAPRKSKPSSGAAGLQSPPVTYMHICGTEMFSMGVFLLRTGTSMPLHDHPDMNGNLRSC